MSNQDGFSLSKIKENSIKSYILSHAVEYIKQNYNSQITARDIAKFCHCSESYINHIFKKHMNVNIKAYINKVRIEHARTHLLDKDHSVAETASIVGFSDPNYFSSVFKNICGITPTEYKRRFK